MNFQKAPLRWDILGMFIGTTAVAVLGVPIYGLIFGFTAEAWIAFAVLFSACNMAITTGYHRLWSHKSFNAHWSVRLMLALVGALALENSILKWASDHRRHHGHVDDPYKDPYAATRGFWFSHIGWMLRDYPSAPMDFSNVRDLNKDPIVRWQHKYYLPLAVGINLAVPLGLGLVFGNVPEMMLVAGFLRLVVTHHTTFFINSLAHIIGTRPWSTGNTARDNFILAVLTFGEGYHNYHHAHPSDYRNGIRFWQWDPSKWLIRGLSALGLTHNLRTVSRERQRAVRAQSKSANQSILITTSAETLDAPAAAIHGSASSRPAA
ncbi:MAG: fatty acid desaturase [Deltaproteobacteria bacterium]|nr:fatty acid desaturase [Deltaproteobacteria bacterium]